MQQSTNTLKQKTEQKSKTCFSPLYNIPPKGPDACQQGQLTMEGTGVRRAPPIPPQLGNGHQHTGLKHIIEGEGDN